MLNILLATASIAETDTLFGAGILAMFAVFGMFVGLMAVAVWVYSSFAYMAIAKKNKQAIPGLAWIPVVGPSLVASKAAKMHWWPLLLLLVGIIPLIGWTGSIAFSVFFIIWNWKMMEAIGNEGWWAIFILIWPVYLVMLGIAAWNK